MFPHCTDNIQCALKQEVADCGVHGNIVRDPLKMALCERVKRFSAKKHESPHEMFSSSMRCMVTAKAPRAIGQDKLSLLAEG